MDDRHLLRLASHLTERDRVVIRLLYDHRVLTSLQVCDVAFSSVRRAEARLHALYELRVVDRFRPHQWPGSAPYHWVLDQAGAAVIAAERGLDVKDLPWRHERVMALQDSITLRHRVGCNGFFTALLRDARGTSDRQLGAWWSASYCAAQWGELARPDGYGVWHEDGARVPFILEYDRGTESGPRLAEKLPGYRRLLSLAVSPTWLLFCFETARREVEARRVLVNGPRELATAVCPRGSSPAGAVWLPLPGLQRHRLGELAQVVLGRVAG
ncbi:MAG TPA: replication-relaxation family protein [Candidatus Dormibacteraeota bacterium]|nr:replication-relaxation family protein [Candidatus Dormibacteraeota bacterium]